MQKIWKPEEARTVYRQLRRAPETPAVRVAVAAVRLYEDAFRDSRLLGEALARNLAARDWGALAGGMPALSKLKGDDEQAPLARWLDKAANALMARHSGEQYVVAARALAQSTLERHALGLEDVLWDHWRLAPEGTAEPDFAALHGQLEVGEADDESLMVRWTVLLGLCFLTANWLAGQAIGEALGVEPEEGS